MLRDRRETSARVAEAIERSSGSLVAAIESLRSDGRSLVPFQPRGDKPVYCSDCFAKNRSASGGGGYGGGGYGRY